MKTITITSKVYGTNAERLAMNLSDGDTEIKFYETDTNSEHEWKGSEWVQTSVNGAVSVSTGPASTSRNRNIAAANSTYARSTNSASWLASLHISSILIVPVIASGATPVAGDILGYAIINGPNESFCAAAFADAGTSSTDVQYKPIIMGVPCEIQTVLGDDYSGAITQLDIWPVTTGRFIVEAN